MKKVILAILFLSFSVSLAQEKYMIYFKDKGEFSKETLSKYSAKELIAKESLSEKSIERRKKNLGKNYFTYQDLPIEQNYVKTLHNLGIKIENKLKWFNAVSAFLTNTQFNEIRDLKFVEKIESLKN